MEGKGRGRGNDGEEGFVRARRSVVSWLELLLLFLFLFSR